MTVNLGLRISVIACCTAGLIAVFLFQQIDIAAMLNFASRPIDRFLINRTFRFLLNDGLAIGIIWGIFSERKYLIFALWTQLIGMVFFLVPYFVLKLYHPFYNGPLISYLHRLILNPTLLLLLIPAFYYQKIKERSVEK
jgi:exosortase F-associated protein